MGCVGAHAGRTFQPLLEPPVHLKNMQGMPGQPSNLVLQTRGSKFVKFQEVRIQELADEVRHSYPPTSDPHSSAIACLWVLSPVKGPYLSVSLPSANLQARPEIWFELLTADPQLHVNLSTGENSYGQHLISHHTQTDAKLRALPIVTSIERAARPPHRPGNSVCPPPTLPPLLRCLKERPPAPSRCTYPAS